MRATQIIRSCINNLQYPKCIKCKHFLSVKPHFRGMSKCYNYGTSNIVTGEIDYDFADTCRNDSDRCGLEAKDFIKSPKKWFNRIGIVGVLLYFAP